MRADAAALILAGGQSRRMGRDKTQLELAGQTLLNRSAAFWGAFCTPVMVAVGTQDHLGQVPGVPVYDAYPDCGPLAGLEAGLGQSPAELLFVSAVDLPWLEKAAAMALYNAIGSADAAVYRLNGRREPLFGLYRKTCQAPAAALLQAGDYKMGLLLDRVNTVYLDTEDQRLFVNLNTPEDFQKAIQG